MTMADVVDVRVPRQCIAEVHTHLRAVGEQGHEGFGLWVGRREGRRFDVAAAIIPRQRHIRTADGVCVVIKDNELHRLNVQLFRADLTILAQIHSHPRRAYHSDTDNANAVATSVGCLSLVVPNFARAAFDFASTAVYRLDARGTWQSLSKAQAAKLMTMVE